MLCCRAGCLPGLTLPVLLLCLQAAAAAGLAASLLELCVSHHSVVAFEVLRMVRPVPDCRLPGLSSCKAIPQAQPAKTLARALCLPLPPPLLLTTSRPSVHLACPNTYSCIVLARLWVAPCRAAPLPPPCLYATTARTAACWTCPPGSSTRAAWWLLQTSVWVRGGIGRIGWCSCSACCSPGSALAAGPRGRKMPCTIMAPGPARVQVLSHALRPAVHAPLLILQCCRPSGESCGATRQRQLARRRQERAPLRQETRGHRRMQRRSGRLRRMEILRTGKRRRKRIIRGRRRERPPPLWLLYCSTACGGGRCGRARRHRGSTPLRQAGGGVWDDWVWGWSLGRNACWFCLPCVRTMGAA